MDMEKLQFQSDYSEGCHPDVLGALTQTNLEQTPGYGVDHHCQNAQAMIKDLCACPHAQVHFVVGGTQANKTVIAACLRPWQGVLSSELGHIATHESGAIESAGHKVLPLPSTNGLIDAGQIEAVCREYAQHPLAEHVVMPGMVYLSHPSETGTMYTKARLQAISQVCRHYQIPLFLDGARLGYALGSEKNDLTLPDLAKLCDVFYIGGTKCGALFGEAVVITNPQYFPGFRGMIKQQGVLLAKGRLLGLQFETLLTGGLYSKICAEAVSHAMTIRKAFEDKGIPLWSDSWTNQQFVCLTHQQVEQLSQRYVFDLQAPMEDGWVVRFCTSWATTPQQITALVDDIASL